MKTRFAFRPIYMGIATPLMIFSLSVPTGLAAEPVPPVPQVRSAAAKKKPLSAHRKLCAMLGLKVGGRYEFLLAPEKVYYYQVVSLGANGWVLMEGFNYPDKWVNLSNVISITPIPPAWKNASPQPGGQ